MEPPDIEKLIPKKQRLRFGIFFTPEETVNRILKQLPESGVSTIIDTAAGSGRFLEAAAKKWPSARLWGIEKNPDVYRLAAPRMSRNPRITWLLGDCLTDSFDIPRCDLYLGNPPFINHADLDPDYRDKVRPLWLRTGLTGSGYRLLLGESRADLAALIFHITLEQYLKPGGGFGVVLPLSLLSGGGANSGFQRFENFQINYMEKMDHTTPFKDAVQPAFFITGKAGGVTTFPVKAQGFPQGSWRPIPSADNGAYRARQGINTLGGNQIFLFGETPPFRSPLIRPLFQGPDPKLWKSHPRGSVLLPYQDNGRLLTEEELHLKFPEAEEWLLRHRKWLEGRKSPHLKGSWFALFGVGPYTFAPWKVIWRAMGQRRLRASVTDKGIPNQALHGYIPVDTLAEADYLAALLNSDSCNTQLAHMARPGSLSFGQPGSVSRLPLPYYNPENHKMRRLSELGALCRINEINEVPKEINLTASEILGVFSH